ncbi:MAG: flippase-like domain-containing protein [Saprospiraceae bacterium]|nr:flippase-like domain-containing protein [Saprospiraceae bacterium]MBL0190313.1 flippase-like domain-containing protein [Saprospiraceae bacterium]
MKIVLKALLVLLFCFILLKQTLFRHDFDILFFEFTDRWQSSSLYWLWGCLILMPINWALEAIKWRLLMMSSTQISWTRTFQSIMSGIAMASVTPARIGEYAGKVLFVESKDRWLSVSASFVSSLAQLYCIWILGWVGTLYLINVKGNMPTWFSWTFVGLGLMVLFLIGFLFFNANIIGDYARRIIQHSKLREILGRFRPVLNFENGLLLKLIAWAMLRVLVYSLQFAMLLKFFGVDLSWISMFSVIWAVYLFQSGLPLPPIMGLVARGEIAIFLFNLFGANALSVAAATFGIWMINLILPALIGLIIILANRWKI